MPTVDAVNEAQEREAPPGTPVPVWAALQRELREQGIEIEPVPVVDEEGPGAARDPRGAAASSPATECSWPPGIWGGMRSSPWSAPRSRRG